MGSVEFESDAELCKNWGYPIDPEKKCQNQIDAERKAALYQRIKVLEDRAERHGETLAATANKVDSLILLVYRMIGRIEALERRSEDDGK